MDISNKSAVLIAVFVNLGGIALEALGIKVSALPLLIFSVFGIVLVLVKNSLDSKTKKIKGQPVATLCNDAPRKQQLLDRLGNLADDPCFNPDISFDKEACIKWANKVEVLLKGKSSQYNEWVVHRTTMLQTHDLFDGMGYLISRMKNILDLAIREIREEINSKTT